jgi:hypothetical protein
MLVEGQPTSISEGQSRLRSLVANSTRLSTKMCLAGAAAAEAIDALVSGRKLEALGMLVAGAGLSVSGIRSAHRLENDTEAVSATLSAKEGNEGSADIVNPVVESTPQDSF